MAKLKHAKLSERHKVFVVQRLAQFDSPAEAAEALSEEHGIEIKPQSAERYDPNKRAGQRLAKHLRELFFETRTQFLNNIERHVPEANKAVRIRQLANAARALKGQKNYTAMADMLERIAKELGNVHTNRHEFTGKDGGPIKHEDVTDMTDDQVGTEIDQLLGKATTVANGDASGKPTQH